MEYFSKILENIKNQDFNRIKDFIGRNEEENNIKQYVIKIKILFKKFSIATENYNRIINKKLFLLFSVAALASFLHKIFFFIIFFRFLFFSRRARVYLELFLFRSSEEEFLSDKLNEMNYRCDVKLDIYLFVFEIKTRKRNMYRYTYTGSKAASRFFPTFERSIVN